MFQLLLYEASEHFVCKKDFSRVGHIFALRGQSGTDTLK
jgi:hypothetical protein